MTYLKNLPNAQRERVQIAKDTPFGYSYLKNLIVSPLNDTLKEAVGAEKVKYYAKKMEGSSYGNLIGTNETAIIGSMYYEYPDAAAQERNRKFSAVTNGKIYMTIGGREMLVRNVTADGYTIQSFSGYQAKNYMYCGIGDATMSAKVYRYDGGTTKAITAIADYDGTVADTSKVTMTAHGLQSGVVLAISGTTDYNGEYTVTVIDNDNFYIAKQFTTNQSGSGYFHILSIHNATGLESARLISGLENRITVAGAGTQSDSVTYSELDVAGDYGDFVPDTGILSPGVMNTGRADSVTALALYNGISFLFGRRNISAHRIGDPITVQESAYDSVADQYYTYDVLQKDNQTLELGYSVDGYGTSSQHGAVVARGSLFYCDEWNGVFSYDIKSNQSRSGKELSAAIRPELLKYDLSSVALGYHPLEDILMVSVASQQGGANDIVFIYSFQAGGWSTAPMYIKQFLWDDIESQMYGVSSIRSCITKVFNGTHINELGEEIECVARSRYFDAGRESQLKEYMESAVIMGVTTGTEEVTFNIYTQKTGDAVSTTYINPSSIISPVVNLIAMGTWGETMIGGGARRSSSGNPFVYIQYYNFDVIDDHRRCAIEIVEKSGFPFAVYNPDVTQEIMDETEDDFYGVSFGGVVPSVADDVYVDETGLVYVDESGMNI